MPLEPPPAWVLGSRFDNEAGALGRIALVTAKAAEGAVAPRARALPSLGSAEHGSHACRPCLFISQAGACPKGALCEFCHEEHTKTTRRRPHKQQRERTLRFVEKQLQALKAGEAASQQIAATQANANARPPYPRTPPACAMSGGPMLRWPCPLEVYSF